MGSMNELESARREFSWLTRVAGTIFTLQPLAQSLLPPLLQRLADKVLAAHDEDEFLDALDEAISTPELMTDLHQMSRVTGLKKDDEGELTRLRAVLGDEYGAVAAIGHHRALVMLEASKSLRAITQPLQTRTASSITVESSPPSDTCAPAPDATLMDLVCADIPAELSKALLNLSRATVCWVVFVRADEKGGSISDVLRPLLAETYAAGPYPTLQVLAGFIETARQVVPPEDVIDVIAVFGDWFEKRRESESLGVAELCRQN